MLGIVDGPAHFIQEATYSTLRGQSPKESTKRDAAFGGLLQGGLTLQPKVLLLNLPNTRLQLSFNEVSLSTKYHSARDKAGNLAPLGPWTLASESERSGLPPFDEAMADGKKMLS